MRCLWAWIGFLASLAAAPSAAAADSEWRQARTNHFILNLKGSEEEARDFAVRLERFDAALRRLYGVADNPDQHARPVTIYKLKDDDFLKVCGCYGALGVYHAQTAGSFIFSAHMPDVDRKAKAGGWTSQVVLLHEYAHHFMYSNFPIAYPYWFSEGFAEFNANASFEEDGSIIIGYPANYRGPALKGGTNLTPKRLFDPHRYGFDNANPDLVYGRGWLLTHYLVLNPGRQGQLAAYLAAMNKGKLSLEAAEASFGDLDKLNKELDSYLKGQLAPPLRIQPGAKPAVTVTTLSPGQAAMLPVIATVRRGLAKGVRMGVAMRAAKIADRYPDDAVVQAQWAEAELYAERFDRAERAAHAALKLKPDLVEALVTKGDIAVRRASEAKSTDPAVWTAARAWYRKANRADPNAVMPLYQYYLSFAAANAKPTRDSVKGLMRVAVLAPESRGVRVLLARQMLADGEADSARFLLQPIAFAPHRKSQDNKAREIVDLIDAGKAREAEAAMTKELDKDKDES